MPPLKVCVVEYEASRHRAAPAGAGALYSALQGLPDITVVELGQVGPFWRRFDSGVRAADAVWPLAPLAGGLLERLSRHVLRRGRVLLGSQPEALRVCASKRRSAQLLAAAGVAVAPSYGAGQPLPPGHQPWMVMPDDGAGWSDACLFTNAAEALSWSTAADCLRQGPQQRAPFVLQPFIAGKPGSLSLLCSGGKAQLLACNELRVAVHGQQFHVLGMTINHLADPLGEFERIGQAVAAALPGLWGHVSVDFVMAAHGAVVLRVGPPPACIYAGLHASLGCNPAALVLDLIDRPLLARVRPPAVAVSVDAGDWSSD